jgi:hypothetical protein
MTGGTCRWFHSGLLCVAHIVSVQDQLGGVGAIHILCSYPQGVGRRDRAQSDWTVGRSRFGGMVDVHVECDLCVSSFPLIAIARPFRVSWRVCFLLHFPHSTNSTPRRPFRNGHTRCRFRMTLFNLYTLFEKIAFSLADSCVLLSDHRSHSQHAGLQQFAERLTYEACFMIVD